MHSYLYREFLFLLFLFHAQELLFIHDHSLHTNRYNHKPFNSLLILIMVGSNLHLLVTHFFVREGPGSLGSGCKMPSVPQHQYPNHSETISTEGYSTKPFIKINNPHPCIRLLALFLLFLLGITCRLQTNTTCSIKLKTQPKSHLSESGQY